ncbi:MAG: choice-of-anchor D domain-containing protein, partial [Candidatus Kapaibacterium sp.]
MSIVSRLLAWHARCVPTLIALALMAVSVAHAQLEVRSRTTNFDTTLCGTTKCRPLVFKNSGATQITITSVDAFFAPFQLDPTTPFNFPRDIAPGDSLAFIVCYTPAAAGQNDAFTGLIRYDVNSTISYTLTGRSTGPALSVTVNNPNYGTVQIFNTVCLGVKLTNTGDGAMALGAVTGVNPPFSLLTLPPATLAPGGSADVLVCFTPSKEGAASVTPVFNYTACGAPQSGQITLNGLGALPPKVALGPVLQINPDPLNFDTTLCGTTKCQTMTFRNLGSSPLNFSRIDQLILPFTISASTPLAVPFTLQPNESRTVQLCYSPVAAPANDSQRVTITSDNRVSLSIATVFDTSGSMTTVIGAGVTRIAAANAGGRVFLDNLVNDPARGIVDEAEVIRFSSAVTVAQGFSTNTVQLRNAVPASASGSTKLYDALNTAIDQLNTRNQPGRRVIVLLTDGDDDLDFSDPGGRQGRINAMAARTANNVRIFTIGLGGGGGGLSANGINTLQ